jgi:hypothetical protein
MRKAAILILLAASACEAPKVDQQHAAAPLPPQICEQAREGLGALKDQAAVVHSDGEATIDNMMWMQMGQDGRDQLVRLLAIDAACAAETPPREQEVTVRDETGRTITQQTVPVTFDIRDLVGGQ